ncbi:MAG: DUF2064 domain-containing protein [Planctomycetes bacterium]|nr:DUF2064 domain-containing protein [Planctomycetota bacterium]
MKTRLVPTLSSKLAADLALALLDDTVAKCRLEVGFETILCVAPPDSVSWFEERYASVARIVPQVGDGLGERLANLFERELSVPGRTLVAIGSDAPHIPSDVCREAHERLERGAGLVVGLDDGGGYHLIGMSAPHAELFTGVPMSSSNMGERTVRMARSMGLVVEFVERAFDIDEPADMQRLVELIGRDRQLAERLPHTAAFFARTL